MWVHPASLVGDYDDYGDYTDNSHNEDYYCDKTAYMFSFVLIIMAWVAVPISLTCCCVAACCGVAIGLSN